MSRTQKIFAAAILLVTLAALPIGSHFYFQSKKGASQIASILSENGFIEFKPPSRLVPPGTWVEVLDKNPLRLGIICPPEEALGANSLTYSESPSIDATLTGRLSTLYSADAEFLKPFDVDNEIKSLKSLSLKLTNVRLLELPDSVVLEGIKSRTASCSNAISFRTKRGAPVSMVKSALRADIVYLAEFHENVSVDIKSDLERELALKLGAQIEIQDGSTTNLVGHDLIWGIREDAVLALVGFGLPSTGGSQRDLKVLGGNGPITSIEAGKQTRKELESRVVFVRYDVPPIKQSSTMNCWAAVFAMMRSWQNSERWTEADAVKSLGKEYVDYLIKNTGLPGGKELAFVNAAGMQAKPPASYTLSAYVSMLKKHGPLWIIVGDGISSHARLLVGIYGDELEESLQSYQKSIFEFIDPLSGNYQYLPAIEFLKEFETEAAWIVDTKQNTQDLRWQILHL